MFMFDFPGAFVFSILSWKILAAASLTRFRDQSKEIV